MTLKEQLAEEYPDLLFLDGFDDALIGVVARFGMEPVALYDKRLVLESLVRDFAKERNPRAEDDEPDLWVMAEEFFDFNIIGAWVGEQTPAFANLGTPD